MSTMVPPAPGFVGRAVPRVDAPEKVTGRARYALDRNAHDMTYALAVQSTVAAGRVVSVELDPSAEGVLDLLWHGDTVPLHPVPDFADPTATMAELQVLQSDVIAFRGQIVAVVTAETLEQCQHAALSLKVTVRDAPAAVELSDDDPRLVVPEQVFVGAMVPNETEAGDVDVALAAADHTVDLRSTTAPAVHNPMEPHSSVAHWGDGTLTVHESSQGPHNIQATLAVAFGIDPASVRVISEHVGGGFGSKALLMPPTLVAAMAAKRVGRPVKFSLTRRQMFSLVLHRPPTIQRVRLGASAEGVLTALDHDVVTHTSQLYDYVETAAVHTRSLYAAPNRRSRHRFARLNVPTPGPFRAPATATGTFAIETAIDALAVRCRLDPIQLRLRNEPEVDPATGRPFSSRRLVECLEAGAERFGWEPRTGGARLRRQGDQLIGTGVAAACLPALQLPGSAVATAWPDGRIVVRVGAVDIGTGARTVLLQLAAEELHVSPDDVELEIGDSALPPGSMAIGSTGTASWGMAVVMAARQLRERLDREPPLDAPVEAVANTAFDPVFVTHALFAFGAHFIEVGVDVHTAEVRVRRAVGAFAAGRIINPLTARSQLLGGITMGISTALMEGTDIDAEMGGFVNEDFAGYHIATNADVPDMDVVFVDDEDPHMPLGIKGVGELGIAGVDAAVSNAVYDATGTRALQLPIRVESLLGGLEHLPS